MRQLHRDLILAGVAAGCTLAVPAAGQFASDGVELKAWINLPTLGATSGNDCWGYVSESGREYALMGVRDAMVVVEITDPANPVIVGEVPHVNTLWGDVKTYQHYAYVVNDNGGGGMDVVDLSDVDNGNVTHITSITAGGLSTSHNVAVDETSGFLYLCGANINSGRLSAYDLSNPESPVFAGAVLANEGVYVHDAQIVTYETGPFAGQQIAFCANGGTGLDIYDVTSKGFMVRLSRTTYAALSYAHQCWLSADRQYLYLNDELDGINRTTIFDVSDPSNPEVVGEYDSGVGATDHNLYVHDGFIFEAEYRAGLRIFCADDPLNPVQVGWFDSYPENDGSGFDGAWSVYPFFPSGTVIISDINRGLFIVDPSAALTAGAIAMSYPGGRPDLLDPAGGTTLQVALDASCGAVTASDSVLLHYDTGGGFTAVPMTDVGGGLFEAAFPAADCGLTVDYYVSAESEGGGSFADPPGAPGETYSAITGTGQTIVLDDDFEADLGWTAANLGATTGDWMRGVPVDDPDWSYDPASDSDGSGQCYLTQNEIGNTDVDDGAVQLASPLLDMTEGEPTIAYDYYLMLTEETGVDKLLVEISSGGDAGPWTEIARHDTSGGLAWRHHEISPGDLADAGVTLTSTMMLRFTANDGDPQSIVEAGLDAFQLKRVTCDAGIPGDIDGDGSVGILDFLALLAAWGPCPSCDCPEDLDGDCTVGILDLLLLLSNWG